MMSGEQSLDDPFRMDEIPTIEEVYLLSAEHLTLSPTRQYLYSESSPCCQYTSM